MKGKTTKKAIYATIDHLIYNNLLKNTTSFDLGDEHG